MKKCIVHKLFICMLNVTLFCVANISADIRPNLYLQEEQQRRAAEAEQRRAAEAEQRRAMERQREIIQQHIYTYNKQLYDYYNTIKDLNDEQQARVQFGQAYNIFMDAQTPGLTNSDTYNIFMDVIYAKLSVANSVENYEEVGIMFDIAVTVLNYAQMANCLTVDLYNRVLLVLANVIEGAVQTQDVNLIKKAHRQAKAIFDAAYEQKWGDNDIYNNSMIVAERILCKSWRAPALECNAVELAYQAYKALVERNETNQNTNALFMQIMSRAVRAYRVAVNEERADKNTNALFKRIISCAVNFACISAANDRDTALRVLEIVRYDLHNMRKKGFFDNKNGMYFIEQAADAIKQTSDPFVARRTFELARKVYLIAQTYGVDAVCGEAFFNAAEHAIRFAKKVNELAFAKQVYRAVQRDMEQSQHTIQHTVKEVIFERIKSILLEMKNNSSKSDKLNSRPESQGDSGSANTEGDDAQQQSDNGSESGSTKQQAAGGNSPINDDLGISIAPVVTSKVKKGFFEFNKLENNHQEISKKIKELHNKRTNGNDISPEELEELKEEIDNSESLTSEQKSNLLQEIRMLELSQNQLIRDNFAVKHLNNDLYPDTKNVLPEHYYTHRPTMSLVSAS